jgi:nitrite reductase/ring-hydroxylating ferredoxin subunit
VAEDERLICASAELADAARGARFEVNSASGPVPAFAIRYEGTVRGYVNRCPHLGTELDWQPGEFFEMAGLYLVCSTHGALFEPKTGHCVAGPCRGASLEPLELCEREGRVYLLHDKPPATNSGNR